MKEYLLLFRNQDGHGRYITTPQDMAEDMPKWQAWIGNIAMQGKLVSSQPIFYEGTLVSNEGVGEGPHTKANEVVAGYLLCKADSLQQAIEWSKTCPILKYPQATVEVREMMPFAV